MKTRFTKTLDLFPEHTKTLYPVTFTVPKGTNLVGIRFAYSPREVDNDQLARQLIEEKLQRYAQECSQEEIIPQAVLDFWSRRLNVSMFLPLRNLLNFSLYDPNGDFVGRWDSPQYFNKW